MSPSINSFSFFRSDTFLNIICKIFENIILIYLKINKTCLLTKKLVLKISLTYPVSEIVGETDVAGER